MGRLFILEMAPERASIVIHGRVLMTFLHCKAGQDHMSNNGYVNRHVDALCLQTSLAEPVCSTFITDHQILLVPHIPLNLVSLFWYLAFPVGCWVTKPERQRSPVRPKVSISVSVPWLFTLSQQAGLWSETLTVNLIQLNCIIFSSLFF